MFGSVVQYIIDQDYGQNRQCIKAYQEKNE